VRRPPRQPSRAYVEPKSPFFLLKTFANVEISIGWFVGCCCCGFGRSASPASPSRHHPGCAASRRCGWVHPSARTCGCARTSCRRVGFGKNGFFPIMQFFVCTKRTMLISQCRPFSLRRRLFFRLRLRLRLLLRLSLRLLLRWLRPYLSPPPPRVVRLPPALPVSRVLLRPLPLGPPLPAGPPLPPPPPRVRRLRALPPSRAHLRPPLPGPPLLLRKRRFVTPFQTFIYFEKHR
jgi:hypothetical protein